ncbi:MAG: condensation domain-containing protein [Limnospira sp. PMC 1291.21]|uniref:phthiocerol/phthiodiolone dimycocerosyl transferase family protein n=1 Tax=unclassified Limnospira TaxID=2642885 RepID=UPI0028E10AB5|nr:MULTISPECIES: condensation domain-containing protein [unclassified Limnospira]MDT9178364.1 condensation domain-containing protein [Limnospira sp. PMC 1238.20]MDT9193454.1 condensation domain-containing protein [Limnospira sp. PMC 1245.20]MDT9208846.1 condensation domain-containing protein [Limnospira sp. PMC 1252.20]MDT9215206.1 condensation domain-containing protein [Limnospira sp. PMC 1256.20]MDT9219437.1 condensation domain-containing protein [Limnospira sp. PMC 1240.20]
MSNDRKLIAMEQGMELCNRYANSLNVVIVSKLKGVLDEQSLRKSLDLVQERHPRLNCHIVGSGNDLFFHSTGTQPIPLTIIFNVQPDLWQEIVIEEMNTKIESEKCLVRAILLTPKDPNNFSYFITTIHHAIIDAACGINLHSEIFKLCQDIGNQQTIDSSKKLEAPPSLEKIISNYSIKDKPLPKPSKYIDKLPCDKYVPYLERRCKLIQRHLSATVTKNLISQCKEKGATVHGAISSGMMLGLADHIRIQEEDFHFSCRSSVNMRKRVVPPVSNEDICMLVSALTSFHIVDNQTSFWDLTQQVTAQIKTRLNTTEVYNVIKDYRKGIESTLENTQQTSFSIFVTNIGNVEISADYGQVQLEEISYVLSTNIMGSVFAVAVSTFQGKITLNFLYSEPLVSQQTIEQLVEDTIKHIVESCQ